MTYKEVFANKSNEEISSDLDNYRLQNKSIELKCLISVLQQLLPQVNGRDIVYNTINCYMVNKLNKVPLIVTRKYKTLVRKEKKMLIGDTSPELPTLKIIQALSDPLKL